jgi:glycosyltransferase involved in cell wall biosynthesis
MSEQVRRSWDPALRPLGLGGKRLCTILAGLDMDQVNATAQEISAVRSSLAAGGAGPILLNVGRLVSFKAQDLLIDSMREVVKKYPTARLAIAGEGPDRPALEERIRRHALGSSVMLLGDRKDIGALLGACDLFVFPSHNEGFGLALLEAMAAGRPVVATRLPVFLEFVEEGTCAELFTGGNSADLARAILTVLDDPARMESMGREGRRIVTERFTQRAASAALERLYADVLQRPRGQAQEEERSPQAVQAEAS